MPILPRPSRGHGAAKRALDVVSTGTHGEQSRNTPDSMALTPQGPETRCPTRWPWAGRLTCRPPKLRAPVSCLAVNGDIHHLRKEVGLGPARVLPLLLWYCYPTASVSVCLHLHPPASLDGHHHHQHWSAWPMNSRSPFRCQSSSPLPSPQTKSAPALNCQTPSTSHLHVCLLGWYLPWPLGYKLHEGKSVSSVDFNKYFLKKEIRKAGRKQVTLTQI